MKLQRKGGINMSTLAFASLTTRRENSPVGKSVTEFPPGVSTYVDALAALMPAEILALHATILSVTTETTGSTTVIVDSCTLSMAFWGMAVLSMILYAVPRLMYAKWDNYDYCRVIIPPLAFVGWTMLQRATAFDAVYPHIAEAPRTVLALFLAVLLGLLARLTAYKADQKPQTNPASMAGT